MTLFKRRTHKRNRLSLEGLKRAIIHRPWFDLQVTQFYRKDHHQHTNILRHMDFYVMPVVNVDGYDYTWKKVGKGRENKTCPLGDAGYAGGIIPTILGLGTMVPL